VLFASELRRERDLFDAMAQRCSGPNVGWAYARGWPAVTRQRCAIDDAIIARMTGASRWFRVPGLPYGVDEREPGIGELVTAPSHATNHPYRTAQAHTATTQAGNTP
jgi:hypothetical protein